jgi:hypothetical protein
MFRYMLWIFFVCCSKTQHSVTMFYSTLNKVLCWRSKDLLHLYGPYAMLLHSFLVRHNSTSTSWFHLWFHYYVTMPLLRHDAIITLGCHYYIMIPLLRHDSIITSLFHHYVIIPLLRHYSIATSLFHCYVMIPLLHHDFIATSWFRCYVMIPLLCHDSIRMSWLH